MIKQKTMICFGIALLIVLLKADVLNALNPYYYNFEIDYNKRNIKFSSVNIEFYEGDFFNFNPDNNYSLEIISKENSILYKEFFSIPNFVLYDFVDENGNFTRSEFVILDNTSFNLYIPYHENAYQVIIYDKDRKELDREFLSQFSKQGFDIHDFIEENEIETKNIKDALEQKDEIIDEKSFADKFNNPDSKIIIISLIIILIVLIVLWIIAVKNKWK